LGKNEKHCTCPFCFKIFFWLAWAGMYGFEWPCLKKNWEPLHTAQGGGINTDLVLKNDEISGSWTFSSLTSMCFCVPNLSFDNTSQTLSSDSLLRVCYQCVLFTFYCQEIYWIVHCWNPLCSYLWLVRFPTNEK